MRISRQRRLFTGLLLLMLLSTLLIAADSSSKGISVLLDGQSLQFDVQPREISGRVLVPLRGIGEALGATVNWDGTTRTVTVLRSGRELKLTIGQTTAHSNGQAIKLEAAPVIINKRTLVPVRLFSEALGAAVDWEGKTATVVINDQYHSLPVIGSYANLKQLVGEASRDYAVLQMGQVKTTAAESAAAPGARQAAPDAAGDFSSTNVQVQGVDEADIIKTDGNYIYQVNNQRVVVVKALPAAAMQVTSMVKFEDAGFTPQELYVDSRYLVVIGSTYQNIPVPMLDAPVSSDASRLMPEIYPYPGYQRQTVKAIVYDLSDKSQLRKVREVEIEGNYVTSRKIGPALYLVANKYLNYSILDKEMPGTTPAFRDSAGKDEFINLDYQQIRYFPGQVTPNYLLIAGLNLDRPEAEAQIDSYLGAGENIYASQQNLYVALTSYQSTGSSPGEVTIMPAKIAMPATAASTRIFKFALAEGKIKYTGKGEVPGTVLNQFSMDEHQGYFRIATTSGDVWRNDANTSRNNIYILDQEMAAAGKLENIAPGERIYSVRFMGERGYMVTFKTVDPLFVISLQDPRNPSILGELKIPGYSDYLHPYDANHIIGFGKETIELPQKDWTGKEVGTMAYYLGIKMAIFDVSDVTRPVEKFKALIGDRGTDSELLHNHKALLFARDKNLMAFPVTVMEVKDQTSVNDGFPQYGQFSFQGAYVYNVDLVKGFDLAAKITHLSDEDYQLAGQHWYDSAKNVRRVIYIGSNLYTLSDSMIQAHDLGSLQPVGSLAIPK